MLPVPLHPEGEASATALAAQAVLDPPVLVDTLEHRYHVEWDPHSPVTPLGRLGNWCSSRSSWRPEDSMPIGSSRCPLQYNSPNAPKRADVLGTCVLTSLARRLALCEANRTWSPAHAIGPHRLMT